MKDVMEGVIEGERAPGRPRMGMLEELKMKGKTYEKMKWRAEKREEWRNSAP